MAVSDTNIYTSIWDSVKTIIVAAAPYTVNSVTSSTTAASIRGSFNDKVTSLIPQIVIETPRVSRTNPRFSGTIGDWDRNINVMVDCYADTSLNADRLAEQVENALDTTEIDGLTLSAVSSDGDTPIIADNKYSVKSLVFTYFR